MDKVHLGLLVVLVSLCLNGAGSVGNKSETTTTATTTTVTNGPVNKIQPKNANALTSTVKPTTTTSTTEQSTIISTKNAPRNTRQVQYLYSPYILPSTQANSGFPFSFQNVNSNFPQPQPQVPHSPQYAFWSNLQTVPSHPVPDAKSGQPSAASQSQSQGQLQGQRQLPGQSQQLFQLYPQFHLVSPYQFQLQSPVSNASSVTGHTAHAPVGGAQIRTVPLPYVQVEQGNIWNFDDSLRPKTQASSSTFNGHVADGEREAGKFESPKRNAPIPFYFPFANAEFGLALDSMLGIQRTPATPAIGFQRGAIEGRPGVGGPSYSSAHTVGGEEYQAGNSNRLKSSSGVGAGGFVRAHVEAPPSKNNHNGFSRHHEQNQIRGGQGSQQQQPEEETHGSFNRGAVEGAPEGFGQRQSPHRAKNIEDYSSNYENGNILNEFTVQTGEEADGEFRKNYNNNGARSSDKKVVCYFANWAWYRKGKVSFLPEHIDPMLCTHVIYAFSTFDKAKTTIAPSDVWTDVTNNFYRRVVSLKEKNPNLKVLLSVGGWADSGDDKYSKLAHNPSARVKFAMEAVKFLQMYGFDGLAVDWHYPKCWQSNCDAGPASDSIAFGDLLRTLKEYFQPRGLLLSATLSGYKEVIDLAYHVPTLNELLDLMNVMVYDYHGAWEQTTGHVAPLFYGPAGYDHFPFYNANFTMEYYVSLGADRSKLIMGIPMYGQTFTLAERINTQVGAEANGAGDAGEHTQQPGMLAYYEICKRVREKGWTVVNDRTGSWGPIAYSGNQWVGYDDPAFVARKARYIQSKGFGGAFVWTMDLDDFNNECCQGPRPLLRTIASELLQIPYDSRREDCTPPPPVVAPPEFPTTTFPTVPQNNVSEVTYPSQPTPAPWPAEGGMLMEGSPCQSSKFTLEPAADNCAIYYQCVYDKIKVRQCSAGLHYNAMSQTCDWPDNARCQREPSGQMPTTMSTMAPRPTSMAPSWPTTRPTMTMATRPTWSTTRRPTPTAPPTMTDCVDGDYLAAEDCSSYYLCTQGRKTLQRCGPGLHWDRMRKLCDWPSEANCQMMIQKLELGLAPPDMSIRQQPCSEGSYQASKTDCSKYYVCVHGENVPFSCQGGLYWNQNSKNCDWPSNAGCDLSASQGQGQGQGQVPSTMPPMGGPSGPSSGSNFGSGSGVTMTPTMLTTMRPPTRPPPVVQGQNEALKGDFMLVCYFTNWAWYRQGEGKYKPENINENLCTHVVYGFAVLDRTSLTIKVYDGWADLDNRFYEQVTALRSKGIKVSIAIGGWNDSEGDHYSRLVNSPAARTRFVLHVIKFIQQYNFDGLDLDWEYPKCWQVNCDKGPDSDKANFALLVKELKEAFMPHGYLLSSAVSPSKTVIDQGYDVPMLSRYLDWIAVMTYDYHGQWDKKTGHVAPLYFHEEDDVAYFNTNYTINYWINQGADRKKIIMGMPLYGQSFTLVDARMNGLNAPASGGGTQGRYTKQSGFLAYYEICQHVQREGWTVVHDESGAMGPYAYKGNQWVSFDDVPMIAKKSQLIRDLNIGGGMVWALDLDDFRNVCGQGEYPLLTTIKNILSRPSFPSPDRFVPVSSPSTAVNNFVTNQQKQQHQQGSNANVIGMAPGQGQGQGQFQIQPHKKIPADYHPYVENDVCDDEPYKPHDKDCNKYYQCLFGRYVEQRCPPGTFWNMNRCDWTCGTTPGGGNGKPTTQRPSGTTQRPQGTMTDMTTSTTRRPTMTTMTTTRPTTTSYPRPTSAPGFTTDRPFDRPPKPELGAHKPFECPASGKKPDWEPATATETNTASPVDVPDSEYKMVCYFTNWAWYRPGIGKYKPADIDFNLCTHIAYGFAVLDGTSLTVRPHDGWADLENKFYRQVVQLKARGLKVVLAIGGWNDSAGDKYSRLVNNPDARRRFVEHMVEFLEKHCFDGLDLDWEYPKCWQVECNKGPDSDKQGFADLVREISAAFKPRGLLLSSAVSPSKTVIDQGYDVPTISKYMDWISVMTYDYHGQWDKKTGHVAPMYLHEDADNVFFNTNYTINYWISQGADRKKIIMGMPMYGQSFTLVNANDHGLNSKSSGGGTAGEFTRQSGFLAYYEICRNILSNNWEVVQDESGAIGPYAYRGNQWASFDDMNMIRRKSEYIKEMGLGGGMIWALDLDDFRGVCGCGRHPLLKTINRVLRNYPQSPDTSSCRLS